MFRYVFPIWDGVVVLQCPKPTGIEKLIGSNAPVKPTFVSAAHRKQMLVDEAEADRKEEKDKLTEAAMARKEFFKKGT
jgi:hypothetical protein